jgi:hypothetical protein
MLGDGTSGAPLGVNSSSVAVFGAAGSLSVPGELTASGGFTTGVGGIASYYTETGVYYGGRLDIGGSPTNWDSTANINGNLSVGSGSVYFNAPTDGMIVSGNVGIGTNNPATLLDVGGISQFGTNGTKSTFTALGALSIASGAALTLSGSGGYVTSLSSVNASAFFGSGARLTGIPSTGSISGYYLPLSGGSLNSGAALTLSGSGGYISSVSSVNASAFFGSGAGLTGILTRSPGFLSATNQALGVGTFSFGYTSAAVTISSMSVIITTAGTGGSSGTVWGCCYGGSCVNCTSSQGAAIGSAYTCNGAVAVPAGGQIVLQITSSGETYTPTANTVCGYQ